MNAIDLRKMDGIELEKGEAGGDEWTHKQRSSRREGQWTFFSQVQLSWN